MRKTILSIESVDKIVIKGEGRLPPKIPRKCRYGIGPGRCVLDAGLAELSRKGCDKIDADHDGGMSGCLLFSHNLRGTGGEEVGRRSCARN